MRRYRQSKGQRRTHPFRVWRLLCSTQGSSFLATLAGLEDAIPLGLKTLNTCCHPICQAVQYFGSYFRVLAPGASWDVERVIRIFKKFEGDMRGEIVDKRLQKLHVGEFIACALEEEHRDSYVKEVLGAFV